MPPRKRPASVAAFLAQLPAARRKELERVRSVVLRHLPAGYEEALVKGMIVYQVPLERYSETYNGHPLWYAALGSQKSGLTLHLLTVYGNKTVEQTLRDGFKAAGKKLDMGKACVRFRGAEDLDLDTIAEVVASTPLDRFVAMAQAARRRAVG